MAVDTHAPVHTASSPLAVPLRDRLGALAGIGFAILFVLFVFLMGSGIPGGEDTNQDIARYYAEADRFNSSLVTLYGSVLAGVCLLWFLASLRQHLRGADERPGALATLAQHGGLICVASLLTAAAATVAIAASVEFGEETEIQPVVASIGWLASIMLTIPAMVGAGIAIVAVSLEILHGGALPRWLAWLGFGCAAAIILLGWAYMPMFALPVWALAASIALLRARPNDGVTT
jgi:hypothetical protein